MVFFNFKSVEIDYINHMISFYNGKGDVLSDMQVYDTEPFNELVSNIKYNSKINNIQVQEFHGYEKKELAS